MGGLTGAAFVLLVIRHVAEDGQLSTVDAKRIERLASGLKVPSETRRALNVYLRTWPGADQQLGETKVILAPPVEAP